MMGFFYVTLGIGGYLGGWLAKLAYIPKEIKKSPNNEQLIMLKHIFYNAFLYYSLIAFITTILSIALVFFLKKWMALRGVTRHNNPTLSDRYHK